MTAPTQVNTLTKEEKPMEFIPYGAQDKIKLSIEIIKNHVAKLTKSGKTCSNRDAITFLMMCSGKRLNPFEGDCFLVGYDKKDGGAEFAQITAETAFLKRAELHPQYDGIESGLILQNEDGSVQEVEGEFYLKGQECLGGWARVHLKTRKIPTYDRLMIQKYWKPGPFWETNPEHQIAKCARVAVLRRSFATLLGGLYLAEEMSLPMTTVSAHEIPSSRLVEVLSSDTKPGGNPNTAAEEVRLAREQPAQETTVLTESELEQSRIAKQEKDLLAEFIIGQGFTFDDFKTWGSETGNLENADSIADFSEVPNKVAIRLLRAKVGLLKGLAGVKKEQPV